MKSIGNKTIIWQDVCQRTEILFPNRNSRLMLSLILLYRCSTSELRKICNFQFLLEYLMVVWLDGS